MEKRPDGLPIPSPPFVLKDEDYEKITYEKYKNQKKSKFDYKYSPEKRVQLQLAMMA